MTPTQITPQTRTFILYVCGCGHWGKWQDQRKHAAECSMPNKSVHARVNAAELRGVRFS